MAVTARCHNCGYSKSLTAFYAGKTVSCPQCQTHIHVPSDHQVYKIGQAIAVDDLDLKPHSLRNESANEFTPQEEKRVERPSHPGMRSLIPAPPVISDHQASKNAQKPSLLADNGKHQFEDLFCPSRANASSACGGSITSLLLIGMGVVSILVAGKPVLGGMFALLTASLGFFSILSRGCGGKSTFPGWIALLSAMFSIFVVGAHRHSCGESAEGYSSRDGESYYSKWPDGCDDSATCKDEYCPGTSTLEPTSEPEQATTLEGDFLQALPEQSLGNYEFNIDDLTKEQLEKLKEWRKDPQRFSNAK